VSESTDITFEAGYRRLQDIAERLGSDEVPVHEMCDLFAEGKGLEQALGDYLSQQKERVEAIERGEGMRAFRVVPPGAEGAGGAQDGAAIRAERAGVGEDGGAMRAGAAANGGAVRAGAAEDAGAPALVPPSPPQDEALPF
jgi:exodeoxyribonuclease VII small subunit